MTQQTKAEYRDKLNSLRFGTPRPPRVTIDRDNDTKTTESIHEETGEIGGFHTLHADGHQDATVTPPAVISQTSTPPPGS